MKPEQVNKKLLWDYDWDESEYETEEFERWYVQRVLTRGSAEDVRRIGLEKIRKFLSSILLPKNIKAFWEWAFEEKWQEKGS